MRVASKKSARGTSVLSGTIGEGAMFPFGTSIKRVRMDGYQLG